MDVERYEVEEQLDSVQRLRQVLRAVDRQLAAVGKFLEDLDFNLRHEGGNIVED